MSAIAQEAQPVFDPENVGASLEVIRAQFPIRAQWLAGSVFGEYTSQRKGAGYDIDGIREYEIGDDPRRIDRNATARDTQGVLQYRIHHKDITPTLWVVTDVLQDRFGADSDQYYTKQRLGLSAVMGSLRMADELRMPTGVVATDSHDFAVQTKQPQQGRRHLYNMARSMAESITSAPDYANSEQKHFVDLLDYAARRCTENVVAIVSDFRQETYMGEAFAWQQALQRLKRQGNDILAIELIDPRDFYLKKEAARFRDPVANRGVWIGSDRKGEAIRENFRQRTQAKALEIDNALRKAGAHHIKLRTDDPRWRDTLRAGLKLSRKRR